MNIKLNVNGFIAIGTVMATEAYIIGILGKRWYEENRRAKRAETKVKQLDRALDLYEIANEALSREIDELEKKLES